MARSGAALGLGDAALGREVAAFEYPVRAGGNVIYERLVLRDAERDYIRIQQRNNVRAIITTYNLLLKDLSSSVVAENLALRLLTPLKVLFGESEIKGLRSQYVKRVISRIIDDVVGTYELAAINLRIPPSYFLVKWVKSKIAILPHLSRLFWWLDTAGQGHEDYMRAVLDALVEELDEACRLGMLVKADGFYSLNPDISLESVQSRKRLKIKGSLRPPLTDIRSNPRLSLDVLRLVLSEVQQIEISGLSELDPENLLYVPTARGLQPVSHDEPLLEALRTHLSLEKANAEFRIERRGSLLNSTFLLRIYVDGSLHERLFVKKYLSWSDIKWIAAKLWALPLRNFYLMPGTRMGNELFFLSYLRERGFRVPEIVYVSWKEKALVEGAIEAMTLTEAWTKMRASLGADLLERATTEIGRLLAEIHGAGIVLGDCKPDNFLLRPERGEYWVVDLEQASLRGSQSWDLSELVLYMGHYLSGEDAEKYASLITRGYLEIGRRDVVEKALNSAFQIAMLPWTPIWTQVSMFKSISAELNKL